MIVHCLLALYYSLFKFKPRIFYINSNMLLIFIVQCSIVYLKPLFVVRKLLLCAWVIHLTVGFQYLCSGKNGQCYWCCVVLSYVSSHYILITSRCQSGQEHVLLAEFPVEPFDDVRNYTFIMIVLPVQCIMRFDAVSLVHFVCSVSPVGEERELMLITVNLTCEQVLST